MLSKEAIEEFKKIWKEDYKREISDKEAYEAANNLLGFFDLLLKIDRRNRIKHKIDNKLQKDYE